MKLSPSKLDLKRYSDLMFGMDRWIGKTAVVTGASSGIGAAVAVSLANEGMNVVGLARRVEKVKELNSQVTKAGTIHGKRCDVCNIPELMATFEEIKKEFGSIHVLVNNAGLYIRGSATDIGEDKVTNEDIQTTINTNVLAPVICAREAIRSMVEQNVAGHVININSIEGHQVIKLPEAINIYPATKFFITAFNEVMRQEISNNSSKIKTTSVSPGFVNTSIFSTGGTSEEISKLLNEIPVLKPKDIADAIIYLLGTPPHVNISELTIKPVGEVF